MNKATEHELVNKIVEVRWLSAPAGYGDPNRYIVRYVAEGLIRLENTEKPGAFWVPLHRIDSLIEQAPPQQG